MPIAALDDDASQGAAARPAATPDYGRRTLWAIFVLALVLRVAAIVYLAGVAPSAPVTYEHGEIARHLVAGEGFSIRFLGVEGPTSQQAPLYPYLLAAIYLVAGVESSLSILIVELLQAVVGALTVACVFRLARGQFPDRPGVALGAALFACCYPPHIYAAAHVQVVVWAMALVTWLLVLVTECQPQGHWRRAIIAGLIAGLLLLVDPILALSLPIVSLAWIIALWQRGLKATHAFGSAAAMAGVAALMVSPWIARNYAVHGEFVFIKSTFGYAFWQANNPHSHGTDKIPKAEAARMFLAHDGSLRDQHRAMWEARHETIYIDDVLLKPDGYRQFVGLSEPARSRLLFDEAAEFVRGEPAAYAALCLKRLRYFLLYDATNPKTMHPLYRASTIFWITLAGIGLCLSWRHYRTLWPTWAIFATITLFHTLTITSARFRMPIEPLSFVWVGLAAGQILARCIGVRRISSRRPLPSTTIDAPSAPARRGGHEPHAAEPIRQPHWLFARLRRRRGSSVERKNRR